MAAAFIWEQFEPVPKEVHEAREGFMAEYLPTEQPDPMEALNAFREAGGLTPINPAVPPEDWGDDVPDDVHPLDALVAKAQSAAKDREVESSP